VHASGTVTCWGQNRYGQLGNGTRDTHDGYADPAPGAKGITDAKRIATGTFHTCVVRSGGEVACFGDDIKDDILENGQDLTPVPVNGLADAREVAAGLGYVCVLRRSGRVACWGANDRGQLGDGRSARRNTPEDVPGLDEVVQIAGGDSSVCVRRKNGDVLCWGRAGTASSATAPRPERGHRPRRSEASPKRSTCQSATKRASSRPQARSGAGAGPPTARSAATPRRCFPSPRRSCGPPLIEPSPILGDPRRTNARRPDVNPLVAHHPQPYARRPMTKTRRPTDALLKELRDFGLEYPGAHTKSPWPDHLDLAVNDKTFAYLSVEGEPFSISCKLPHSGAMALALPNTEPTAYGLGKSGWVSVRFPDGEVPPIEILKAWIDESYRAQAPKKLVKELESRGAAAAPASAKPSTRASNAQKKASPARKATSAARKPARG
jgi:predicted DNA-binding protein (MmcQ/YjbR family)